MEFSWERLLRDVFRVLTRERVTSRAERAAPELGAEIHCAIGVEHSSTFLTG